MYGFEKKYKYLLNRIVLGAIALPVLVIIILIKDCVSK